MTWVKQNKIASASTLDGGESTLDGGASTLDFWLVKQNKAS